MLYYELEGGMAVGQWDKLIADILALNPNLRFEELSKALCRVGYTMNQPKGGSSHYTFRKQGCMPVTLPKQSTMNKVYIELVAEAVQRYLDEEG